MVKREKASEGHADCLQGISFDNLHLLFAESKRFLLIIKRGYSDKHDPLNTQAMRSVGTKVAVEWRKDNDLLNWKPGWYLATVRMYNKKCDIVILEYVCEPSKEYTMQVDNSVKKGRLKVARKDVAVSQLYNQVTEIGAQVLIK